jgi:hypothetical protein
MYFLFLVLIAEKGSCFLLTGTAILRYMSIKLKSIQALQKLLFLQLLSSSGSLVSLRVLSLSLGSFLSSIGRGDWLGGSAVLVSSVSSETSEL